MKLIIVLLFVALVAAIIKSFLFSFRSQKPSDYANTGPTFDLRKHLSGEILSEGLIYGPTGRMTNSFVAKMYGEWGGNTGTLAEHFTYPDGSQQHRKWYIKFESDDSFTATADDIVGQATGVISGSTLKMEYRIRLPEESGGHVLDATDWLYLAANGTVLNKSELRKYGIKVVELIATMRVL